MARTKRPRAPSKGGRDPNQGIAFPSHNELAESLVEAHLEGFLGRKRLHAYEKGRMNQDLERCLQTNWETLKKRMNKGEETVEFCFEHNYHEYEPNEAEVREALPPELKALSNWQWIHSGEPAFKVTVTGVGRGQTSIRDWVIGIEADKDYLADIRATALNAALERGEDVEEE